MKEKILKELNELKKTTQEKLDEIQERIFIIDMIDVWSKEDAEYWQVYKDIEYDLKKQIEKEGKKYE